MRRWWWTVPGAITVLVAVLAVGFLNRPARTEGVLAGVEVVMHKSPTCGCCGDYVTYLRQHGAQVRVVETVDLAPVKARLGVPAMAQSCHTMEMAGYAVEGHVPLEALERLLGERPGIAGIALPGMPAGSPGMSGEKSGSWQVMSFDGGESGGVFGSY